jgi:nucleoside-diphosphate-sugar epimerase
MVAPEGRKVVVTGGSGSLGSHVIRELLADGWRCLNLDIARPQAVLCETWTCNLTRAGDLYEAFKGADAAIHLAAYQAPNMAADCEIFRNNMSASYNVLKVAHDMGLRRVVMASSVAAYGFLYAPRMWSPDYLPLDEDYPCKPQDPYAHSKVFAEQLADAFVSQGVASVVSLRISGVNLEPDFRSLPRRWADPGARLGTFWSYVDLRDAAVACRLALTADLAGHHIVNIAAETSRYLEPTSELVERYLPGTRVRNGMSGHWGGLDCTRAKSLLAFEARHVWRNYLEEDGTPIG